MNTLNSQLKSLAFAVFAALTLSGCNESGSSTAGPDNDYAPVTPTPTPDPGEGFEQQAMVDHLATQVITPTIAQFQTLAQAQTSAVDNYCQVQTQFVNGENTQTTLDESKVAAQDSWRNAMAVWQQIEVMQIGPLPFDNSTLRNKIYSWPIVNSCHVDLDVGFFTLGEVNGAPYDIALRTSSRKGLAAMEYLLFNNNLEHSCESTEPTGWATMTDNERMLARCAFSQEVTKDIENNTDVLVSEWQNYVTQLTEAGTANSSFATSHDAVNAISDALFYVDTFTKDGKLAQPLGLMSNPCGSQACPEAVESGISGNSVNNILNNLIGFQKLFTGTESGTGFEDYLIDVGDQDTADTMSADINTAIADTQSYSNTLAQTLEDSPEQVEQTHAEVKKITDKLKADFITSLSLELPQTAAGDND